MSNLQRLVVPDGFKSGGAGRADAAGFGDVVLSSGDASLAVVGKGEHFLVAIGNRVEHIVEDSGGLGDLMAVEMEIAIFVQAPAMMRRLPSTFARSRPSRR